MRIPRKLIEATAGKKPGDDVWPFIAANHGAPREVARRWKSAGWISVVYGKQGKERPVLGAILTDDGIEAAQRRAAYFAAQDALQEQIAAMREAVDA